MTEMDPDWEGYKEQMFHFRQEEEAYHEHMEALFDQYQQEQFDKACSDLRMAIEASHRVRSDPETNIPAIEALFTTCNGILNGLDRSIVADTVLFDFRRGLKQAELNLKALKSLSE